MLPSISTPTARSAGNPYSENPSRTELCVCSISLVKRRTNVDRKQ